MRCFAPVLTKCSQLDQLPWPLSASQRETMLGSLTLALRTVSPRAIEGTEEPLNKVHPMAPILRRMIPFLSRCLEIKPY